MSLITIAAISQKGGVSKTTLMTGFAACAAPDMRVWIADMDPLNASAFRWWQERKAQKPAPPFVRVETANSATQLKLLLQAALDDGAELLLIDTPQGTGEAQLAAMAGARLVLVPTKAAFFDINAILITLERASKEGRQAYVVFVDVEPGAAGEGDVADATRALRAGAKEMGISPPLFCEHVLHHNREHQLASAMGMSATETAPKTKPAHEMKSLARWAIETAKSAAMPRSAGAPVVSIRERMRQRAGRA